MSSPASVSGAAAASAAGTGASADVARAASVSVHDAQVQQPNSQHGSMQPPIGAGQGAGREAQDGVDSLVDSIGDLVDQGDGPRSAGLGTGTAPGQGGGPDGASASKGTGEGPGPGGPGLVPQLPPALMPTPQTARRARGGACAVSRKVWVSGRVKLTPATSLPAGSPDSARRLFGGGAQAPGLGLGAEAAASQAAGAEHPTLVPDPEGAPGGPGRAV